MVDLPKVLPPKWRVWLGVFPIYLEGQPRGKASIDIIKRKQVQANVHLNLYSKGKYPYFREKDKVGAYTLRLPLPAFADVTGILEQLKIRVRKQPAHRWQVHYYDMTGPAKHVTAKSIVRLLDQAERELHEDRAEARALYLQAVEAFKNTPMKPEERTAILKKANTVKELLHAAARSHAAP